MEPIGGNDYDKNRHHSSCGGGAGGDRGTTCGASGMLDVTVTSLVRTPVRVVFRYRRPWEKDVEPWKLLRLVVNTVTSRIP